MHPNAQLITKFYEAFARGDGDAMSQLYHPEATFSDPVFTGLKGDEVGGMWRMLTGQAKDLVVTFRDVRADDVSGSAHWEATYTFATGRKVHNVIDATFRFKGAKVVAHTDVFDFYAWSKQALGVAGTLLGWTGFLRKTVGKKAYGQLQRFLAKEAKRSA